VDKAVAFPRLSVQRSTLRGNMKKSILVILCIVLIGCNGSHSVSLPTAENIYSMRGAITNSSHERGPYSGPIIEEFEIPAEDYRRVLDLLASGKIDKSPARWQALGYVKIMTSSSSEIAVLLFSTGGGKGAFRIGDTYYRGSKDYEIVQVLLDCHKKYQIIKRNTSNMQIQPTAYRAA
jgi:hypothetical protein